MTPNKTEVAHKVQGTKEKNKRTQQNSEIDSYSNKSIQRDRSPTKKKTKSKKWKKAMKRQQTKWVSYSKTANTSDIANESQTEETESKQNSQTSSSKLKKHKKKGREKQTKPTETKIKVHTHAALYRNPQDFSSNWKKLQQVMLNLYEHLRYFFKLSSNRVSNTFTLYRRKLV